MIEPGSRPGTFMIGMRRDKMVSSLILHPPWGACRTLSSFANPEMCEQAMAYIAMAAQIQDSFRIDDILAFGLTSPEGVLSSLHEKGKSSLSERFRFVPIGTASSEFLA